MGKFTTDLIHGMTEAMAFADGKTNGRVVHAVDVPDENAGLVCRRPMLVKPAGGATISQEQANRALDEVREGGAVG